MDAGWVWSEQTGLQSALGIKLVQEGDALQETALPSAPSSDVSCMKSSPVTGKFKLEQIYVGKVKLGYIVEHLML